MVQQLRHHDQQVMVRHKQSFAQRNCDGILNSHTRHLQPMSGMAAVIYTGPLAPFLNWLFGDPGGCWKAEPNLWIGDAKIFWTMTSPPSSRRKFPADVVKGTYK